MRTLKKSLCLVLALVFVLGLCTIGTNAAYANYTDLEDVTDDYMKAVEVLTGLRVINGYTDDSFGPQKEVTRAEAAAMICRMMLGRDDADKLPPVGEDVSFPDVPATHWAAKYIAFCYNKGIIIGKGDGFHPDENVTGTEMATMLLRALGYGAIGEYKGKGWDINAVADALYHGVFKNSKVTDFNQPATREETALYVWNTLWLQLVGWDVDLNYYTGKEYRDGIFRRALTFAKEAYDLIWAEEYVIVANQATGSNYTVAAYLDADGDPYGFIYLNYTTDLSYIGRDVDIFYEAELKEDKVEHLEYHEGFLVTIESVPFTKGAKLDDFYRAAKEANKSNLDVWFEDVPTWKNYDYNQLGVVPSAANFDAIGGYIPDSDDTTIHYYTVAEVKGQKSSNDSAPGGTWILNRRGEIMLVLKTDYRVAKVVNVDADHEEVELNVWNPGYYYPDIYDLAWNDVQLVYDGIAKDDYVQVQPVGDLFYVYPTTTKTVDIVEVNSLFFSFNNFAFGMDSYGYGIKIPDQDSFLDVTVGDKVKFYVIEGAYSDSYFGLEIVEKAKTEGLIYVVSVGEYLEHTEWDVFSSDIGKVWKVQGINQDGEEVVYKVSTKDYTDGTVVLPDEGSVVEVRKQGKVWFFDNKPKNVAYLTNDGNKTSYLTSGTDTYFVDADTKVIYFKGKGKDLEIEIGSKLAKSSSSYDVYASVKKSGGNYKLNTVWVLNPAVAAPDDYSNESILYVGGYYRYVITLPCFLPMGTEPDNNGDTVYYYYVYIDGVLTKVHVTGDASIYMDASNGSLNECFYLYKPTTDGSGVLELKPVASKAHYDVKLQSGSVKNGRLFAAGSDAAELKVTVVDASGDTTIGTKTDANVLSIERLEELLSEGYTMYVDYMYVEDAEANEVPVGTMYVTQVIPPASLS